MVVLFFKSIILFLFFCWLKDVNCLLNSNIVISSKMINRCRKTNFATLSRLKANIKKQDDNLHLSSKTLIIVESPSKAKTIEKFLDSNKYIVDYCAGHVRELSNSTKLVPETFKKVKVIPELNIKMSDLGVDIYNNFEPVYVISEKKNVIIKRLLNHLKTCNEILFATDEDREGEAITWHLIQLFKNHKTSRKIPYKRICFHEITKSAVLESFLNSRDVDMNLVHSQETRRILDRLAGYTLSPVLWR